MLKPLVVAHRGASAQEEDNTLAAFDLAIQQGADFLELDVHLTKDSHLLIMHSASINANGKEVEIAELTLSEIRHHLSRNAPSKHSKGVLTLDQLINWRIDARIQTGMLIDLKNARGRYPGIATEVARAIIGNGIVDNTYIVSFDHELLLKLKGEAPAVQTGLLYVAKLANLRETIRFTGTSLIETPTDYLDEGVISVAHEEHAVVCGWSTNDPEEIRRLCSLGVDLITTDKPGMAKQVISEYMAAK